MSDPAPEPDWKVPTKVEAREGFTIWIEFNDGVSGEVDLSDLAQQPAFACWRDRARFERVRINGYDYLDWGDEQTDAEAMIEPDEVYTRLTGLTVDELYPEWVESSSRKVGLPRPVRVEARAGLSIWIEYSNGESGTVDLSHHRGPAFAAWQDRDYFESVQINQELGSVEWSDGLDLCPDSLYAEMKGTTLSALIAVQEPALADG